MKTLLGGTVAGPYVPNTERGISSTIEDKLLLNVKAVAFD